MKRTLFRQIIILALFTCGLSADVPDWRASAPVGSQMVRAGPRTRFDFYAHQKPMFVFSTRDGITCQPALSAFPVRPLRAFGMDLPGRGAARLDLFTGVAPGALRIPDDPLEIVFGMSRSARLPVARQSAGPLSGAEDLSDFEHAAGRADRDGMISRLKKIFAQQGVPEQWVWMAEIESAMNPQAQSSAGAVGLFQLMPATARRFGLQIAPWDDRREPEKSAVAAAQYLKFLHQKFGCWSLALAAYNSGEGRVQETMRRRNARTFEEIAHFLPAETRAYVPKVMAIAALREDQMNGVPGARWMP